VRERRGREEREEKEEEEGRKKGGGETVERDFLTETSQRVLTDIPPQRQNKLFKPGQSVAVYFSPENNLMLILNFFKINKVS
jgi:hypothetical protein